MKNKYRNISCPCDSGFKFKKCCWNTSARKSMTFNEGQSLVKKHGLKHRCLVPETLQKNCGKKCNAHSISKQAILRQISEDNQLIRFEFKLQKVQAEASKIGINKASTFAGFCDKHDNEIFKDIDKKNPFGTKRNYFLMAYRALCMDLHNKMTTVEINKELYEKSPMLARVNLRKSLKTHELILTDLKKEKSIYDEILTNFHDENITCFEIKFDGISPIVGTFSFDPHYDFHKTILQDPDNRKLRLRKVILTMFFDGIQTILVLVTIGKENNPAYKFIQSLSGLDFQKISDFLFNCLFEYSENIYCNPSWWEKIEKSKKDYLMELYSTSHSSENEEFLDEKTFELFRFKKLLMPCKVSCFNIKETKSY